jgi:archaellum biogenesis ATPase FlaH
MIEYVHHRQDHKDVVMILRKYVIFLLHLQMFQLGNKWVDNLHLEKRIVHGNQQV